MNDESKFSVDEILEAERKAKANGSAGRVRKNTPGVTEEPDAVTEPETEQPVEEASAEVATARAGSGTAAGGGAKKTPRGIPTRRKKSPERKRRTKKRRKRKKVFGRAAVKRSRKRFLTKPKTCTTASS